MKVNWFRVLWLVLREFVPAIKRGLEQGRRDRFQAEQREFFESSNRGDEVPLDKRSAKR